MDIVSRRAVVRGALGVGSAAAAGVAFPAAARAATYPTVRVGSTGSAVVALQQRLSALGYWLGAVDGQFGPLTQQAVYAIQKAAGVVRDGIVGPITWSKVTAGVRPAWRTHAGNLVEIDKPRQLLKVIRNGQLSITLSTSTGSETYYLSSSGRWALAHTPTGWFRVLYVVNGVDHGPLGDLYRPRYFTWAGHAVHGAASIPPYPASHGCCRVSNGAEDMVWARNLQPLGSTVYVY